MIERFCDNTLFEDGKQETKYCDCFVAVFFFDKNKAEAINFVSLL